MRINLFGRRGMFPWTDGDEYEEDAEQIDIPINAFDTIIADECHRGYTSGEASKWREVLHHLDAIKIGLTATPAKHTTAYSHHLNAADDFSSLSVVLGSLGGDTCIAVEIVSPLSGGNLHHFCLN